MLVLTIFVKRELKKVLEDLNIVAKVIDYSLFVNMKHDHVLTVIAVECFQIHVVIEIEQDVVVAEERAIC